MEKSREGWKTRGREGSRIYIERFRPPHDTVFKQHTCITSNTPKFSNSPSFGHFLKMYVHQVALTRGIWPLTPSVSLSWGCDCFWSSACSCSPGRQLPPRCKRYADAAVTDKPTRMPGCVQPKSAILGSTCALRSCAIAGCLVRK